MSVCESMSACRYFNETLGDQPTAIIEGFKNQFCKGDVEHCARKVIGRRLGKEAVPCDLGPHQHIRAVQLLREAGQENPARDFL